MPLTLHVDIVSAEEAIFSGKAEMVVAPASGGEVGIYPRHAPMLTTLKPGEVIVREGGEDKLFFVSGGVLEVQPEIVTVLSDTAIRARDLDEAKALEAKQRAEDAMKDKKADMDYARAQIELVEALAQLRTIEKLRKKGLK